MAKRESGRGSIVKLSDGRYWVRGPLIGKSRPTIDYVASESEAIALLEHVCKGLNSRAREGCPTFLKFGEQVLDERELQGIRGSGKDRKRFAGHLATAGFANKNLDKIKPADISDWIRKMGMKLANDRRGKRRLSRHTIVRCLTLASQIFDQACPQNRNIIQSNPCAGMKVKSHEARTEEPWTFLDWEEQCAIRDCEAMPLADKLAILFAIGTGLRGGEQFNLLLQDLHCDEDEPEPRVVVRYGSANKGTKSKKIRTVPLFGVALEAARAWLQLLPKFCPNNYQGLVFPFPGGSRRGEGKPLGNGKFLPHPNGTHTLVGAVPKRVVTGGTHRYVDRFVTVLAMAGITRNVRWHDLRHTCASSLVSGMWGEPWTLQEVKDLLGHSSITVTERYAHLGETALKRAAKKVNSVGGSLVGNVKFKTFKSDEIANDINVAPPGRVELPTNALGKRNIVELLRVLSSENGSPNQLVTNLAETLASLLEQGDKLVP